jgi:pimeloyl-ACP methyl ester carboxylesterase
MNARPQWLPESEWPFTPHWADIAGHRVHYTDVGQGPVLLFVHAGFWSFIWRDVLRELSKDFRCVALDFPGTGLSDAAPGYRARIGGHAEVLAGLVAHLGLREVTLVLHDLGAVVGLDFATRQPGTVRALVVAQGFGWWPRQRTLRGALRLMGGATMRTVNVVTNLIPRMTTSRFGVGRHLDKAGRRVFLGPTRDRNRRRPFNDLMRDARRGRQRLDGIEAALRGPLHDRPMLTIFGQRNDPFHFQRTWCELFPQCRQVVVAKGNHFPMNDDPTLFVAAIREWDTATRSHQDHS